MSRPGVFSNGREELGTGFAFLALRLSWHFACRTGYVVREYPWFVKVPHECLVWLFCFGRVCSRFFPEQGGVREGGEEKDKTEKL